MESVTTAIGFLLIILGFLGQLYCRKQKPEIIGGVIDTVTKEGDEYKVTIGYITKEKKMEFIERKMKRMPLGKCIQLTPDLEIYHADLKIPCICLFCFVIGAILCAI